MTVSLKSYIARGLITSSQMREGKQSSSSPQISVHNFQRKFLTDTDTGCTVHSHWNTSLTNLCAQQIEQFLWRNNNGGDRSRLCGYFHSLALGAAKLDFGGSHIWQLSRQRVCKLSIGTPGGSFSSSIYDTG